MISCFIHIILLVLKFHGYSEPGAQSSRLPGLWSLGGTNPPHPAQEVDVKELQYTFIGEKDVKSAIQNSSTHKIATLGEFGNMIIDQIDYAAM
jgi:hypothetical protein